MKSLAISIACAALTLSACSASEREPQDSSSNAAEATSTPSHLKINFEAPPPDPQRPHIEALGIKAGDDYRLHVKNLDEALSSPGRFTTLHTPSDPRLDSIDITFDEKSGKVCGVFTSTEDTTAAQDYIDRFTTDYGAPVRDDYGLTWKAGDNQAFMGIFDDTTFTTIGWHFTASCGEEWM